MTRVVITGAAGYIGSHACPAFVRAGHDVHAWVHHTPTLLAPNIGGTAAVDLTDPGAVRRTLDDAPPDVIVHAAAVSGLRACRDDPGHARALNVQATRTIVDWCAEHGTRLLFLSTEQVFDGKRGRYVENDVPHPIHDYGRTKLEAEHLVEALGPRGTVVRVSLVYGESPSGTRSFHEQVATWLARGERPSIFTDEFRTPILVDDVVAALLALSQRDDMPCLHLGGPDRVSRLEYAQIIAEVFGHDASRFQPARVADLNLDPPRPSDLSLDITLLRDRLCCSPRPLREGLAAIASRS